MADLTFTTTFFLDWQARGIIGDTYDPGFNPDAFKPYCDILLTPKLIGTDSQEIHIVNQSPKLTLLLLPVRARLENGVLRAIRGPASAHETPTSAEYNEQEQSVGVPLIAQTPALELPAGVSLVYHVEFAPMKIDGGVYEFEDFDFLAPNTATRLDMTTVERINLPPSNQVQQVVRLIPDEYTVVDGVLKFSAQGYEFGSGVDLSGLFAGVGGWSGFTHEQGAAAATWTITNLLGRKATAVTVLVGGVVVEADVTMPDDSTTPIVVTFATPQSGRAEII